MTIRHENIPSGIWEAALESSAITDEFDSFPTHFLPVEAAPYVATYAPEELLRETRWYFTAPGVADRTDRG